VEGRDLAPVLVLVALVVTPDGAEHAGPGLLDDEEAALVGFARGAVLFDDVGLDAEEGARRAARDGGGHAGEGRNHHGARLGLPPGVDDGAAVAADDAAVPHPGFG